jgi:hypothetical protein
MLMKPLNFFMMYFLITPLKRKKWIESNGTIVFYYNLLEIKKKLKSHNKSFFLNMGLRLEGPILFCYRNLSYINFFIVKIL